MRELCGCDGAAVTKLRGVGVAACGYFRGVEAAVVELVPSHQDGAILEEVGAGRWERWMREKEGLGGGRW